MLQPNEIVGVMHAAQCCCSDVARDCVEFVSSRQGMSVACDDDIDDVRNELLLFSPWNTRSFIFKSAYSRRHGRFSFEALRVSEAALFIDLAIRNGNKVFSAEQTHCCELNIGAQALLKESWHENEGRHATEPPPTRGFVWISCANSSIRIVFSPFLSFVTSSVLDLSHVLLHFPSFTVIYLAFSFLSNLCHIRLHR